MSQLSDDLQASLRTFRRRPLYPLVAVLILTLGISASVAVFTYFNGFFQPFPGADARGLVRLFETSAEAPFQNLSYLDFVDYKEVVGSEVRLAASQPYYAASVKHEKMTEVAFLEAVSGDFFSVLDLELRLGRGLTSADDQAGANAAAVISHAWWLRSFGGRSEVIGSTLFLNSRPHTIVGVMNPEFLGSTSDTRPDVWIPFAPFRARYVSWDRQAQDRDAPLMQVFGRLADGTNARQATAALEVVAKGLDAEYPRREDPRVIRLEPAAWIDPNARQAEMPTVELMFAAAVGLLVLSCANVANLLLSLALGRQNELAVRSALGASPGRILRHVLTENVVLAGIAGVLALVLAGPLSDRLGSYFARPAVWSANVGRQAELDLRVVAFTLTVALGTGLLAGVLPALRASSRDLVTTLKNDSLAATGQPRKLLGWRVPSLHDLLLAGQVALSVILLVVAGLVLRTLAAANRVDPGFEHDNLLASHISTSSTSVTPEEREAFFRVLKERLAVEPWVGSVAIADNAPLSFQRSRELRFDGRDEPVEVVASQVVPGYFSTLGMRILEGRGFLDTDREGTTDVAVVNEEAVRRFYDGGAIGRRIWSPMEDGERVYEIVGVVANVRAQDLLSEAPPIVYFSYPQHRYPTGTALLVSTKVSARSSVPVLRRWLRDFEPYLAIVNVLTYDDVVKGLLYSHRMNAELYSTLAVLGLALATVGIFSVVTLAVSRRRREIGVRMALGAGRRDIVRLVLLRSLAPVGAGILVGLVGSLAISKVLQGLLFGIEATDPLTLAAGAAILVVTALVAAMLPTRSAAYVDPVTALRAD